MRHFQSLGRVHTWLLSGCRSSCLNVIEDELFSLPLANATPATQLRPRQHLCLGWVKLVNKRPGCHCCSCMKKKKRRAADWLLCQPVGGDTCVAGSCCAVLLLENEQLLRRNCPPRVGVLQPLWWEAPSQVFPLEATLRHRWPLLKCSYCDLFTGITAHIMHACYVDWEKSFLDNYDL